ncbi:restriction endonuclease subunit S [Colwellia psychrerythraea]|uniref:Restriction modification system DNA specificity domain-containing protein n=1 Tax=Colwellia psychrerythraea TaxID=28229 RepID=A0A099KCC5_COLPS|nr:restriction endonuclease subunit S [Colwellia psychrerythraea]KGJ88389.1 restriction modification system DNA specificity domain-containing protein [Colwellia psychrerythraea]
MTWANTPLGDLITLQRGHDLPSQKRIDGNTPIMGSSGVTGFHNVSKTLGPGVVVGRSGNSMGEVSYCDVDFWPLNTCLYITDFKGNDPRYIYYLLKTIDFDQFNSGSAQKSLNRNAVYPFEVYSTSDKKEQIAIGQNLSTLEDKIESNSQINQTLEQIAQAIFKTWFVDFEPVKAKIAAREALLAAYAPKAETAVPTATAEQIAKTPSPEEIEKVEQQAAINAISGGGDIVPTEQLQTLADLFPNQLVESELGEIPEGWEVKALDEVAHYQNGLALQKFRPEEGEEFLPVLKISQLKAGFADGKEVAKASIKPSCIVDNGVVVFSWSASLLVDTWCGGKAALNQHLFKVTSKDYPKWFYTMWTKHHLEKFIQIAADKAVTMGHIKRSHLSEAKCAIPTPDLINLDIIESIIQKQIECRLESVTLSDLRDALLPKLLSGEIDLSNNQKAVVNG